MEDYLAGDRCDEDVRGVRAHLAECQSCAAQFRELEQENAFLADVARYTSARNVTTVDSRWAANSSTGPSAAHQENRDTRLDTEIPPDDVPPGYDVVRLIGRGGQAIVYEAMQHSTQRRVAIKVMHESVFGRRSQARRIEREIRLVAQLRHPGIVTIFDSGKMRDGRPGYAMEYIDGQPIDRWVRDNASQRGRPDIHATLELFASVCDAVRYAHQRGVIHRDLKPGNILVDGDGRPHVLDFGLAKWSEEPGQASITMSGQFLGTLAYAAPEQVGGDPHLADTRTDVYALGVILYELLTGREPLPREGSFSDVVKIIIEREPERPSALRPEIDDELENLMLMALAKDPERRYENAAALLDDVRRYLAGEAISAKRDSAWYVMSKTMRKHRVLLGVAAGFGVLSIAYGATMSLLYGLATMRGDEARAVTQRLIDERDTNRIEHAKMLTMSRDAPLAHEMIWSTHHSRRSDSAPERTSNDPVERQAYWALWQFYRAQPIRARHRSSGSIRAMHVGMRVSFIQVDENLALKLSSWNPLDGSQSILWTLEGAATADEVLLAAFSPDGSRLIWMQSERHRIFDVHSGDVLWDCNLDSASRELAIRESTLFRIPMTNPQAIELWNIEDSEQIGTLRSELQLENASLESLDVSSDGMTITACVREPSTILVWDSDASVPRIVVQPEVDPFPNRPSSLTGIKLSPDGGRIATVFGAAIDLWDSSDLYHYERLRTGGSRRWRWWAGWAQSCVFSENGHWLVAMGSDRLLQVWNLNRGLLHGVYAGHLGAPKLASFNRKERLLVAADDQDILAWDISRDRDERELASSTYSTHRVRFSPDGRTLATGRISISEVSVQGGEIALWNAEEGEIIGMMTGHGAIVSDVIFLQEGRLLASSSHDGTVRLWDVDSRREIRRMDAPNALNVLSASPNGEWLAAGSDDGAVRIWSIADGNLIAVFQHGNPSDSEYYRRRIPGIAFSPGGDTLASVGADSTVKIWEIRSGKDVMLSAHESTVRSVAYSRDGRFLASGGDDGNVCIWDAQSGALLRVLRSHSQRIFSLSFSPDGGLLATGSADGGVALWDPHAGRQLIVLGQYDAMTMSVDFSSCGDQLAASFTDGAVRIFDLRYYEPHIQGNRPR